MTVWRLPITFFSKCRYSRSIFEELETWCDTKLPKEECIHWWLRHKERSATKKKIVGVILANCIYSLLNIRNRAKFDLVVKNQKYVIKSIKKDVISRLDIIVTKTDSPNISDWIERLRLGGTG